MKYDFDRVIDRRGTASLKWDGVRRVFGADDVLPLWVADMDFLPPRPVIEALSRRASQGLYGYVLRPESLSEAIVGWLERRHGWRIEREWLGFTPGVVPALALAVQAYSQPGDAVVVQSPVYPPFFAVVERNGRRLVNNQLTLEGGRYRIDFAGLERCLDSRVKALILCSPHNPVGRVWSREELARVGELCLARGVVVVSDEIHCDLVYPGARHTPLASISEALAEGSVTCIAPSKTFNVAGLSSSGVVIPSRRLREQFRAAQERAAIGEGNVFGTLAWEAAYREGEEWLEQMLAYLQGNLSLLTERVAARIPGVEVIPPEGTYLVWLDCRGLGLEPAELRRFLVEEARVGLNDGAAFGPGGAGFQRLNLACPRSTLEEGLDRIERAVARRRGTG